MKAKVVSVAILAVIVLFVLLCVLPLKFVVGICAAVGIFAMFGAMFLMSINAWAELEKKDPEKAKKMLLDAVCELENQRRMIGF